MGVSVSCFDGVIAIVFGVVSKFGNRVGVSMTFGDMVGSMLIHTMGGSVAGIGATIGELVTAVMLSFAADGAVVFKFEEVPGNGMLKLIIDGNDVGSAVAGRNDCCTIVGARTGETGTFDGDVENDDNDNSGFEGNGDGGNVLNGPVG
mmetsp:Transcript_30651/g.63082  ORF Transcript_30651/g.63082 Transcript_30651/m.63082 type:complete len:148 (-) Transcript_30651:1389-1832(-)